ncbi:MAG: carbohydrate ABC transporter permease [Anaerolineae bacterium]
MAIVSPSVSRARRSWLPSFSATEGYLFISPWFLGFLAFDLFPFLASLYLSLTRWDLLGSPEWIGLRNYERMFTRDPRFWISLRVTTYYTGLAAPTGLVFSFILALLLNAEIKARAVYRTLYYLPSVTAGVATAVLWLWLFNPKAGLVNLLLGLIGIKGPGWIFSRQWAVPALALMHLWGVGGTVIIYLAGLQAVPQHLYEAAEIDGGGAWARMRYVTLPMMSPTIFFTLVMGIIGSFQTFTAVFVMTEGGPADATLFYILYLFRHAFRNFNMGYASALAWVLFIIVLVITLVQIRLSGKWVYYES